MDDPRARGAMELSLIILERASAEYRRVLDDARCSYLDAAGTASVLVSDVRYELARGPGAAAELAARALGSARGDPTRPRALIDLTPRAPGDRRAAVPPNEVTVAFLADPIEMLWWLMGVHEARHVHSRLNAYLYSSDPDDILPFLPYHPTGRAVPEAVETEIAGVAFATVALARVGPHPDAAARAALTIGEGIVLRVD